jgi:hypothetical protein
MIPASRQEFFFQAISFAGVSEREALNFAGINAGPWSRFKRVAEECAKALRDGWSERGSIAEMRMAARRIKLPISDDDGPADLRMQLAEPEQYAAFWRRYISSHVESEVAAARQVHKLAVGGEYFTDPDTGDKKFRPLETRTETIDYELDKPLPGISATGRVAVPNQVKWRPIKRRVTVETHPPNFQALVFILVQRYSERWNSRKGGVAGKPAFEFAAEIMAAIDAANDSVPVDIAGSDDSEVRINPGKK